MEGYAAALEKVIEFGPADPAMQPSVEHAYMNLGTLHLQQAQRAQGDAKQAPARKAADVFRRYIEYKPDDPTGKVRLANALQILGDTAGVDRIYEEMLKDPAQFTSTQLAEAGVASFRGQRYDEALVFFDESLKQNPYHAQTLFNYVNTSIAAKKLTQATERLPRLFEVDPSNVDNFTLAARAWQGLFLDSTSTVEQKEMGTDSTLKYIILRDSSEVSVKFAPFAPAPGNAQTLTGVIENRSESQKSYELSIECLDATGAAVATATVPIPDVGPKSGKAFRAACSGEDIVAFRYKPVT
jgi:tetratricopeptide (TPR) repeat protein